MEIEAKMIAPDLAAVRKKLESAKAQYSGKVLETNSFFDTPLQTLRLADRGLRIRVAVDERGQGRCTVTMKGPAAAGQFKNREEIEFTADDPDAVQKIFENLGYHFTLSFEKRRESWKLSGCKVELDEVPYLGTFVEIEADSEKTVDSMRHTLALEKLELVRASYISMIAHYVEEHQIKNRKVTF